jgi:uncharacterized membrane protein YGL010W
MIPFIEQAKSYASYHKKAATRYSHMAGIPLIILSLMILLGFIHVVIIGVLDVNVAIIATMALLAYYFRLDWRLALALTPVLVILLWIASFFSHDGPTAHALLSFLIIFVIGVALPFISHFIEEKRLTLSENLWQVLIAPLFMVAEVFFWAGRMKELNEAIYGKKPVKKQNDASEN